MQKKSEFLADISRLFPNQYIQGITDDRAKTTKTTQMSVRQRTIQRKALQKMLRFLQAPSLQPPQSSRLWKSLLACAQLPRASMTRSLPMSLLPRTLARFPSSMTIQCLHLVRTRNTSSQTAKKLVTSWSRAGSITVNPMTWL